MFLFGATVKNIPPGKNDPQIIPAGVILHVEGSGVLTSLYNVFLNRGGIESHFYITYDGKLEQYRDTEYEADAQNVNSWVGPDGKTYGYISIETQGTCKDKWTDKQLFTIMDTLLQLRRLHNIPLQLLSAPRAKGVGYHAQFPEFNPNNHACPCPSRIAQINTVLVPWMHTANQHLPVAEDSEMRSLILKVTPDADDDDPISVWVYDPISGELRRIRNGFELRLLAVSGAQYIDCTEAELRSLVPPGQTP